MASTTHPLLSSYFHGTITTTIKLHSRPFLLPRRRIISPTTVRAAAQDITPPPPHLLPLPNSKPNPPPPPTPFPATAPLDAPKPQASSPDLPDGSQWRYSEFLNAVKKGKVERVRFSKDGGFLQLTAVDGRRAGVVVPNDPGLIDILAMNGVDISVSRATPPPAAASSASSATSSSPSSPSRASSSSSAAPRAARRGPRRARRADGLRQVQV
ncbi:putative ATP-dependent zinc metalloprotease FTSH 1, chloroplastic [Iris pallida]|uniref:ATP-dependent zinc metalloprotease FTSH 1, chloroplastic n=1 Tax=Iris pallida TaxID=29817 RepID=A0AAX6GWE6_IRIPA|nr:putative ATP-dependent zinc metalloprotease FTSH 1, chloroplastic [Iris pallida]